VRADSIRARLEAIDDSLVADALAFRSNPYNLAEAVLDPSSLRDNLLLATPETDAGWRRLEAALGDLHAEVERAGAVMILVCIPAGAQVDKRYWWATRLGLALDERVLGGTAFQDRLHRFAAAETLQFIDLLPALCPSDTALYFEQDGHWNAAGHDVAARAIAGGLHAYFQSTRMGD
jgi:hypothetical protein